MLTITKDKLTLLVTSGAYKSIYAPAGWTIRGEPKVTPPFSVDSGSKPGAEDKSKIEPDSEDTDEEEEASEDESSSHKSLKDMSLEELKAFAGELGISTPESVSKKFLRQAIRQHQT